MKHCSKVVRIVSLRLAACVAVSSSKYTAYNRLLNSYVLDRFNELCGWHDGCNFGRYQLIS
jgi:hypothetical protein